jgi:hypothetical protein
MCGDGFMDFIHRLKSKISKIKQSKSRSFGSWLCFRPQVNAGGEDKIISHRQNLVSGVYNTVVG